MTGETTYNGWKNYATWRINLEICDDLTSHLSNDISDGDQDPFTDVHALASYLEEEVDQVVSAWGELDDNKQADLALSYARAFVSDVDFWEIAEAAISDYPHIIASEEDDDE